MGDNEVTVALMGASPAGAQAAIAAHTGTLAEFRSVPDTGDVEAVDAALAVADVVVGRLPDRDVEAPRLRLIHATGAGVDHYPAERIPSAAWLCNAYEHGQGMAEHVIAMTLVLRRRIHTYDRDLRQGRWNRGDHGPHGLYPELREQTMGIVGFGTIGRALLPMARAFGMEVQAVRSRDHGTPAPDGVSVQVGPDGLDDVLAAADVVVLAVPLDEDTRGMIGRRELALMGPDTLLINVARGPVVDEDALYEALVDGTIAGAGIDVWYRYPQGGEDTLPATRPFHELDNVVMTPHTAGWTTQTARDRWAFIGRNIARLARGETPLNVVIAPVDG